MPSRLQPARPLSGNVMLAVTALTIGIVVFFMSLSYSVVYSVADCYEKTIVLKNAKVLPGGRSWNTYQIIDTEDFKYWIDGPATQVFAVHAFESQMQPGDEVKLLIKKGAQTTDGSRVVGMESKGRAFLTLEDVNRSRKAQERQGFFCLLVGGIVALYFLRKELRRSHKQ